MTTFRKRLASEMREEGELQRGTVAVLRCEDPDPDMPADWKISPHMDVNADEECYWGSFIDALNVMMSVGPEVVHADPGDGCGKSVCGIHVYYSAERVDRRVSADSGDVTCLECLNQNVEG